MGVCFGVFKTTGDDLLLWLPLAGAGVFAPGCGPGIPRPEGLSDSTVSVAFMSKNDVLRYLAASSDNAHRAESILENQVGGDLSTEQWLARAAIATQIAHVDAMRALAAANHRLGDQLADIAALLPVKDATPADALAPFRGYRFG